MGDERGLGGEEEPGGEEEVVVPPEAPVLALLEVEPGEEEDGGQGDEDPDRRVELGAVVC